MNSLSVFEDNTKTGALRKTVEELFREKTLRAYHLCDRGRGLSVAEGELYVDDVPAGTTGIYAIDDRLFFHNGTTNMLYPYDTQDRFTGVHAPITMLHAYDRYPHEWCYMIDADDVHFITNVAFARLGTGKGGGVGCFYGERLFTAKGTSLYYSQPLFPDVFTEDIGKGGEIKFPSDAGRILSLQYYKERLVMFREEGITSLKAEGEELNFKAVNHPYGAGIMVERSVASVGNGICFFTRRGFYSFYGSAPRKENVDCTEINLHSAITAVSYRGKYYAAVLLKSGRRATFVYDGEKAYFLMNGAEDIAAGDILWFMRAGKVYKMSEAGYPEEREQCRAVVSNMAFSVKGEKQLEAIALEGEGRFRVKISSGGGTRETICTCFERQRLKSPLRGNGFTLEILPLSENSRLSAVALSYTEDDDDD